MSTPEEMQRQYSRVIAKAWSDEGFKKRLLEDAKAALQDEGIEVPQGIKLRVLENNENVVHFILPPKPADVDLDEEDLEHVVGGLQYGCCMNAGISLGCDLSFSYSAT